MSKRLTPIALAVMTLLTTSTLVWAGDDHQHSAAQHAEERPGEHIESPEHSHDEANGDAHASEAADAHSDPNDHDEEAGLTLDPAQRAISGIRAVAVQPSEFRFEGRAPAQLVADPARTQQISLPVGVRITERLVNAGAEVEKGQPLFRLASSQIAAAQGDYLLALAEWQRVQELGTKAVAASRFQQARIDVQTRRLDLVALGMTTAQIDALTDPKAELGGFTYLAPIAGTVQQDNLVLGLNLDANVLLMQLSDESELWLEAQVAPGLIGQVAIGDTVAVEAAGLRYQAQVIGRDHQLNPQTRTETVRLSLANPQHRLHVGEFATAYFVQSEHRGMVLPDSALVRGGDGDWAVFVQDGEHFEQVEVKVLRSQRGQNLVTGLEPGQLVVIEGAFFLNSEQAKAGFDIHNH
ncbi:efflux RND transporter periplasmic adaptor subunit [Ferrimonas balearica]|uniref:efflux RND transporter periplasmic adaptor subunit n=1 Tax=Ferrimonas balearica TaxID=44012 RepID=UPI001C9A097B|nr:efflux RND transporter periplasmic adaptor subunit [Ferrimonas balearica]MBY5923360.1 efflux RND transporter periplasmic adaptor subunit [Ferrimonas balearica]MBY5995318.1 efflux RND transporter periplasmic adaptor subunit [Ferrimonas balearica]